MTRAGWLTVLIASVAARPSAAQCGLDQIEAGIGAYRDLELEAAQELLRGVVEINDRASSRCATETARALTYLGATYSLLELPDSADRSFESAVIRAPRFRPDALEFPPGVTEAFDRIRSSTPAVAVAIPDEVVIGPTAEAALLIRLSASTRHAVSASIRTPSGASVRTLYQGPVVTGAEGMVIEWSGRDSDGRAVRSGRYELEVISESDAGGPIRKVTVPLTIESDVPPETMIVDSVPSSAASPTSRDSPGSTWKGVAVAAMGLAAGALVIGVPPAVSGFPESGGRYVVGVSLGVAGLAGLFEAWRRRPAGPVSPAVTQPEPAERAEKEPTLRVLAGNEVRTELGSGGGELGVGRGTEPGVTR